MESDTLFSAELIGKLVKKNSSNPNHVLEKSVDIIKSFSVPPALYSTSVYKTRWITNIQDKGEYDKIPKLINVLNFIERKTKNTENLFAFMENMRNCKNVEMETSLPVIHYKQNTKKKNIFPPDFINVLSGVNGDEFFYSSKEQRFVMRINSSPFLYTFINEVGAIGNMVVLLSNQQTKKMSLIFQKAFSVAQNILEDHLLSVSALSDSLDTLNMADFLEYLHSHTIQRLKASAIIINTITGLKGGLLFKKIMNISQHGDLAIAEVSKEMVNACSEIIEEMIKLWVSKGQIIDAYDEFFIHEDLSATVCSEWWDQRYILNDREAPLSIPSKYLPKILDAGKSLNFLRQWDHPIEIEVDNNLPILDYIDKAFELANAALINLFTERLNIHRAIQDIHDYMLIGRGDFAMSFLKIEDPETKRMSIEAVVNEFSHRASNGIDIALTDKTWNFTYNAAPPLSAFITRKNVQAYSLVSKQLLDLKETEYKLHEYRQRSRGLKDVYLAVFEMTHFVQLVLDFFHQQVISKGYAKLLYAIDHPENFASLLKAHNSYIMDIARGCWCSKSGAGCTRALRETLKAINGFLNGDDTVEASREKFIESLKPFRDALLMHKQSGYDLVRPLKRIFGRLIDDE